MIDRLRSQAGGSRSVVQEWGPHSANP